jgi:eukaryotic-like serine/threonine-protein kinase
MSRQAPDGADAADPATTLHDEAVPDALAGPEEEHATLPSFGSLPAHGKADSTLVSEHDPEPLRSTRRLRPEQPSAFAAQRFQIIDCVGSGGMGIVYSAQDKKRGERVALKTLQHLDGGSIARLKHEFRSLTSVQHPNLVRLRELFADGDEVFFTMDLVDGVPLSAFLAELRASPAYQEPLRGLFRQVAEGLAAVHENDKLHRDLKPSNVMVTRGGRAVILDFGVACDRTTEPTSAVREVVAGTPAYMSPEQARGEAMSAASDWYAFGTMLYEALSGRLPFTGTLLEMLSAKTSRDAPPIDGSDAPTDLVCLAQELLAQRPGQRPTAREVLQRLGSEETFRDELDSSLPAVSSRRVGFVGRHVELLQLEGALYRALSGELVSVLVTGASGIGKTALIREFLNDDCAAKGVLVLESKCFEHESVRYNALDGVIDGLRAYLGRLSAEARARLTPRHARSLATLFPALSDVLMRDTPGSQKLPEQPGARRRLGFHALRELLGRVCEQVPVVLFLDDLQWGDDDSARLLSVLLAPPDPPALLLLTACRSDERALSPLLRQLDQSGGPGWQPLEIAVQALPDEDAKNLSRRLLGEDQRELADALAVEARGSPFFLFELALASRHLERDMRGVSLSELIVSRVEGLLPAARELLEFVALAERPVAGRVVESASGLAEATDVWLSLKRVKLVRAVHAGGEERLQCYHDRIAETVTARLSAGRASELHRRLALALERAPDAEVERLAEHFRRGRVLDRAALYAERAGDAARLGLAFAQAAKWYAIAHELWPSTDAARRRLRIALAEALEDAGKAAEAAQSYLAAADEADDAMLALDLRRRAASQLLGAGHADEGTRVLNTVLTAAGLSRPRTTAGTVLSLVIERTRLRSRGLELESDVAPASPKALLRVDALAAAASGYMRCDFIRGAMFASRELRFALGTGDPMRITRALANEILYAANEGPKNARRVYALRARAERMLEDVRDPHVVGYLKAAYGGGHMLLGDAHLALPLLEEAQGLLGRGRSSWALTFARFLSGLSAQICGRLVELHAPSEQWLTDARERNDLQAERYYATFRCFSLIGLDRADAAHEELVRTLAATEKASNDFMRFGTLHAFVMLANYRREDASVLERLYAEHQPFWRSPLRGGQLSRVYVKLYSAYCLLGIAERTSLRRVNTRPIHRLASSLIAELAPYAAGHGHVVRAGAHCLDGRPELASEDLGKAAALLSSVGQQLAAGAASYRLGRLLGAQNGAGILQSSIDVASELGVVNPERLYESLTPGIRV